MKNIAKLMGWALVAACALGAAAQTSEPIQCGGVTVALITAKGKYGNIYERSSAINKAINDCLSDEDTNSPKTSVKQLNGLWTVFAWSRQIMSVYPEEAKAHKTDAKSLAETWRAALQKGLRGSTPVSKMKNPFGPYSVDKPRTPKLAKPGTAPTPKVTTPAEEPTLAPAAARSGVTPGTPPPPTTESRGVTETAGSATQSGPLDMLTILAMFNQVRALTEAEYALQRQQLAEDLLHQLGAPRGTGAAVGTAPAARVTRETPTTLEVTVPAPKPHTATTGKPKPASLTGAKTGSTTLAKPGATAGAKTASATAAKPLSAAATKPSGVTAAKPTGAASGLSNLSTKERINAKFELADKPFALMREQGHPDTEKARRLLTQARDAYFADRFPESEQALDEALQTMGVQAK